VSRLVVDTSVTAAWCFEDETTPFTESILDRVALDGAVVPGIWPFEMANVLAVAERRGRLEPSRSTQFLDTLQGLSIAVDQQESAAVLRSVIPVSRTYGLSAYDAAYLELALRTDAVLATSDGRLRTAAKRAGVAVLETE